MKNKIRRSMMFLNAQRASLVKDAYIYKPDCIIFDLEDAVAESEKDSARIQLFNTLKYVDYVDIEKWVRINPKNSPHYLEDIDAAVAGGCDGIRLPMTETKDDIVDLEKQITKAEKKYGMNSTTMMMAAIESPLGVINAYEISRASERMMGIALSAGDLTRTLKAKRTKSGEELIFARSTILFAARASGIMAFDTVYTDLEDVEGLILETKLIKDMGFDGKSIISPKQIQHVHNVFIPNNEEISEAIQIITQVNSNREKGIGVLIVNGNMVDIAHVESAYNVLRLAKLTKKYDGDLV